MNLLANSFYDPTDCWVINVSSTAMSLLWHCRCPQCGKIHGKQWHIETDLCKHCQKRKKTNMHYKNGRPANNGDRVILLGDQWNAPVAGILYNAVAGNDFCNGRIASTSTGDPTPNLANCLHADDIAQAANQGAIVPLVTDNPDSIAK